MSKNKFLRTCLVTGQKLLPAALLRFTLSAGEIVFDTPKQKNPGRGGYVINDPAAIEKLPKIKKKIAYFLRSK